ncbi:MAG: hypothetical protein ACHQD9_09545 [Chitinophagales bacterium]
MKFPIIIVVKKLHVKGMALFPFILLREKSFEEDKVIMNHERIHHRQEVELLIIPFYLFYVLNYFLNRFRYPNHREAYMNIIFEREAYANENDMNYLRKRNFFSLLKYFKSAVKPASKSDDGK